MEQVTKCSVWGEISAAGKSSQSGKRGYWMKIGVNLSISHWFHRKLSGFVICPAIFPAAEPAASAARVGLREP
jgi:hypothetical protein